MEVLVIILIAVFILVNSGKNNKKRAPAKPAQPGAAKRAKMSQPDAPDAGEQVVLPEEFFEGTAAQSAAVFMSEAQGVDMLHDEYCAGGSMEHTHDEGEHPEEHSRHRAEVRRREAEESLAAMAAQELAERNLRQLRQAVVMSEVLGKPKALRR